MGYTHYWSFKPVKGQAKQTEKLYKQAIAECQKLVRAYYAEHGELSGYTAHTKPGSYGGVHVNGKGEEAHEPFILREHFNQNNKFNFCKTALKQYDTVVVACLAVLKYRLGDHIEVSSDGDSTDWVSGVALARRCLKRQVRNPIKTETDFEIEMNVN